MTDIQEWNKRFQNLSHEEQLNFAYLHIEADKEGIDIKFSGSGSRLTVALERLFSTIADSGNFDFETVISSIRSVHYQRIYQEEKEN